MRTGSAITLSIFVMMIVLGSLLAYTAFYVDQVMLRPVIQMYDAETDLKCFFIISNIVGGEYLRDGDPIPPGTLRSELNDLYGLKSGKGAYLGDREEFFRKVLALQYGKSETVVREQDVFWTTVQFEGLPVQCFMNVFGPARIGTAGLFVTQNLNKDISRLMDKYQCRIDPSFAIGDCNE